MGRREWYRSIGKGEREVPAGCMSGMLQFFDFHHILFTPSSSRAVQEHSSPRLHHYTCQQQLKGVEAPRNSLELDESAAAATTTSTASAIAEEYYGIPIGIQLNAAPSLLKKQKKKDLLMLVDEEKRSSQAETPRTPNVVARLMGLEILPDGVSTPTAGFKSQQHSPKIGENKKNHHKESPPCRQPLQKRDTNILPNVRLEVGTRSLPDTPRASSERSRDADPRLSLQLNKENCNRARNLCLVSHSLAPSPTCAYTDRARKKECFKTQDENRSPRSNYYAREIVKQVKESIHRRGSSSCADEHVIRSRRTRPADKRVLVENERDQYFSTKPTPSTSPPPPPQNRFLEPPKPQVPPKPPRPQSSNSFFKVREIVDAKPIKMASRNKAGYEKFTERIRRQPPPTETATQSLPSPNSVPLAQKHALSCEKIKSSCTVTTTTREAASNCRLPSPLPGRICPAPIFPSQEQRFPKGTKEQEAEFLYVRSILERAGIMSTTQVRWYSPSLPIDPFVFHQLELDLPHFLGQLCHRCNRKLLFHLVEEILADLLSWSPSTPSKKKRLHEINKDLLLERLWTKIKSFPLADCQVIEDIDALIAGDIAEAKVRRLLRHPLVVAEAEGIATEIEEDVMDSIVGEAAASLALFSKFNR